MNRNVNNGYPEVVPEDMVVCIGDFVQRQSVLLDDYRQLHSFENFLAISLLPPQFSPTQEKKDAIYRDFDHRSRTVDLIRGKLFSGNLLDLTVIKYNGEPEEFRTEWHIADRSYLLEGQSSDNCLDFIVAAAAQKMGHIVGELMIPVRIKRVSNNRFDTAWKRLVGPVKGTESLTQAHRDSIRRAVALNMVVGNERTRPHKVDQSFGVPRD